MKAKTILERTLAITDSQQKVAEAGLVGMHKIQSLVLAANRECLSVNDWENAMRKIWEQVNVFMAKVDAAQSIPESEMDNFTTRADVAYENYTDRVLTEQNG